MLIPLPHTSYTLGIHIYFKVEELFSYETLVLTADHKEFSVIAPRVHNFYSSNSIHSCTDSTKESRFSQANKNLESSISYSESISCSRKYEEGGQAWIPSLDILPSAQRSWPLVIIQLNGSSSLNHSLHPISCVVRNISAALNDTQTDHFLISDGWQQSWCNDYLLEICSNRQTFHVANKWRDC